ncbi:DUF4030 domain-containing protein [Mesobacillus subterraneus]|uniref:DUF4030 domain-containing protein n=1 Tax=Mesobacillus subterraneus TaxID=285983 RepID=UPI00203B023B|nr:DUF4030 domain-containing protein [Mesobacillus subterraneus]MCM3575898.1 DUF4030 domain-containing protein [Mesobacillus subterraneus]
MKKQCADTNFDDSLKIFDSDLMWKKLRKQELKKRILTDIEYLDFKDKEKNPYKWTQCKKISLNSKIAYSCAGFILILGLFIGSGFVSPAIAEVISKLPYLNQVFKTESVTIIIKKKLEENGYDITSMRRTGNKIEIGVGGSNGYFTDTQKDIKNIALEVLRSRNYDAYSVKVIKYNPIDEKPSQEILMQIEESTNISESLKQVLKISEDYSVQVTPSGSSKDVLMIYIEIPDTEESVEAIKKAAQNVIKENTDKKYNLEFIKVDINKREQINRWERAVFTIYNGLISKKEYQVKDVNYKAQDQLMTIYIDTFVSSTDSNSKQIGQTIENTVKEFLESKEVTEIKKDDKYQIIIYSKDKQRIN